MPQKSKKNRLRRPPNNPLDFLYGRTWYQLLSQGAGYLSPNEISLKLDDQPDKSRKWERYRDGLRVPRIYGQSNPIAQADAEWPGSAEITNCPIWLVLKGIQISNQEIISGITNLGDEAAIPILSGGFENAEEATGIERVMLQLEHFPTFETLRAIILMLAWADNLGRPDFFNRVCELYREMIPAFIERGNIPFHEEFFDAIDNIALYRNFTSINIREDVFESWRKQLPRYKKLRSERKNLMRKFFSIIPKNFMG